MGDPGAPREARPFVKWAGGKRQLLPELERAMPERFGTYYEPFLGGGALLFRVLARNPRQRCVASDLNADLVMAYVAVRDSPRELLASLRAHARAYEQDPENHYYAVRASRPRGLVQKAARLVFLNRTCFNGLYRVNRAGRFNVPPGRYARPNIANEEAIMAASAALRLPGVSIECADFEAAAGRARRGDLVYVDPPYAPESRTAGFTAYTPGSFGPAELARLSSLCSELSGRGCCVLASNSDTPAAAAAFGGGWRARRVTAGRAINSDPSRRAGHAELLVRNY